MVKVDNETYDEYLESTAAFHFEMPLYHKLDLKDLGIANAVFELLRDHGKVDAYCIYCDKESVFHTLDHLELGHNSPPRQRYIDNWTDKEQRPFLHRSSHECARRAEHRYFCYYLVGNGILEKIGQYPSVADLQIPQIQKYRKILGPKLYSEFARGVGIAAHGIGIGSFVYLRRVFENLIEEAKDIAFKENPQFRVAECDKSKMDAKILMLKDRLPEFLVNNRVMYAVLSKGIHELTEEECLEYFLPMKLGIEQILDEKIREKEKAEKIAAAQLAVQKVHQQVINPGVQQ